MGRLLGSIRPDAPSSRGRPSRTRRHARQCLSALLFIWGLSLSGCAGHLDVPTTIPASILTAIVAAVAKKKNLEFYRGSFLNKSKDEQQFDRHKGFFVLRRAIHHGADEANKDSVAARIEEEFDELQRFADDMLNGVDGHPGLKTAAPDGSSTASLGSAFTCDPAKHLDLINVASYFKDQPMDKLRFGLYMKQRIHSAVAIIWRAAGIHAELWNDANAKDSRLDRSAHPP